MKRSEFDKIFDDSVNKINSEIEENKFFTKLEDYTDENGNIDVAKGVNYVRQFSQEYTCKLIYAVLVDAIPLDDG